MPRQLRHRDKFRQATSLFHRFLILHVPRTLIAKFLDYESEPLLTPFAWRNIHKLFLLALCATSKFRVINCRATSSLKYRLLRYGNINRDSFCMHAIKSGQFYRTSLLSIVRIPDLILADLIKISFRRKVINWPDKANYSEISVKILPA
jgi:hypothetical protein